jgi:hypothetical protein
MGPAGTASPPGQKRKLPARSGSSRLLTDKVYYVSLLVRTVIKPRFNNPPVDPSYIKRPKY